jgi:hypothetical protein
MEATVCIRSRACFPPVFKAEQVQGKIQQVKLGSRIEMKGFCVGLDRIALCFPALESAF